MNNLVEINNFECSLIGGGRSARAGAVIGALASLAGAFAKLCYLAHQNGFRTMTQRGMAGDLSLWD